MPWVGTSKMFSGFNGFLIPKKLEQKANETISKEIQSGNIDVRLQVIDLTATFQSGSNDTTYTYNLPRSGKWLVIVNCSAGGGVSGFDIDTIGIVGNTGSTGIAASGHRIISATSFTWFRPTGSFILQAQAIRLGDP